MDVPRQAFSGRGDAEVGTGRVNQKRRTRAAIVDAAKQLLQAGTTPTVAHAAELALVSRTTAYRYFPTQESLLLEVAVNVDVDEIEALVGLPVDAAASVDRLLTVLGRFNQHVIADEVQYRTTMRLYLDLWLAAVAEGDDAPVVREGRRRRWFTTTLEPLRDRLPGEAFARLTAGLSLLAGPEAITVLRDICQLRGADALAVTDWAARAMLDASGVGAEADLVRRFYDDAWNRWDDAVVDEILDEHVEFRGSLGDQVRGRDGWRAYRDRIRHAVPDFHNEVVELVTGPGRAAARLRYTGHHHGELLGHAGDGGAIDYGGAAFFSCADGRITSAWVLGDLDTLRRQLDPPDSDARRSR